jgi:hypothetical protein
MQTTALPLNELQAAADQASPVAEIPNRDPMVLDGTSLNLKKLNLYRVGVDQAIAANSNVSSTKTYCQHLASISPARMILDQTLTIHAPSPDTGAANSLFTFLAQRFVASYSMLTCQNLTGKASPISVATDGNGAAISATIQGLTFNTPLNCNVNGVVILGCEGTTTINGQTCQITTDAANNHQIVINCPPVTPTAGGGN